MPHVTTYRTDICGSCLNVARICVVFFEDEATGQLSKVTGWCEQCVNIPTVKHAEGTEAISDQLRHDERLKGMR